MERLLMVLLVLFSGIISAQVKQCTQGLVVNGQTGEARVIELDGPAICRFCKLWRALALADREPPKVTFPQNFPVPRPS
jgi:hypothetical protein